MAKTLLGRTELESDILLHLHAQGRPDTLINISADSGEDTNIVKPALENLVRDRLVSKQSGMWELTLEGQKLVINSLDI